MAWEMGDAFRAQVVDAVRNDIRRKREEEKTESRPHRTNPPVIVLTDILEAATNRFAALGDLPTASARYVQKLADGSWSINWGRPAITVHNRSDQEFANDTMGTWALLLDARQFVPWECSGSTSSSTSEASLL